MLFNYLLLLVEILYIFDFIYVELRGIILYLIICLVVVFYF